LGVVVFVGVVLGLAGYLNRGLYHDAMTIRKLLTENEELREAIANLTDEGQIGYAKVLAQEEADGGLVTHLKFVETAGGDLQKRILEKEFAIPGDVVHFDALIVKFEDKMVADGKARALYLWRRIYGETMRPEDGFAIEEPGTEPVRYKDLLNALPIEQRELFWWSIWELANDPQRLKEYGIVAIYGNAVYSKLREGLIYIFKMDATGQVYPEVVPDL